MIDIIIHRNFCHSNNLIHKKSYFEYIINNTMLYCVIFVITNKNVKHAWHQTKN